MIKIIILAFDNHNRVKAAIKRLYEQTEIKDYDHDITICDPHYPLPENNSELLRAIPNTHYIDLERNHGQDGNMNEISKRLKFNDSDILVFWDTDIEIDHPGWIRDAKKLIDARHGDYITVGCWHHVAGEYYNVEKNQGEIKYLENVKTRLLTWTGGWPIGIFSGRLFRGLNIQQAHSYYGASEYTFQQAWLARGMKGLMMVDYTDKRNFDGIDPEYPAWKAAVIQLKVHPDFKDWLKAGGKV